MASGAIAISIAAVIIAAIYFSYLIVRMALQHEEKKMGVRAADERVEQILAETQAESAKLRARVEVLERLATDEDRRVAQEINKLGVGAEKHRVGTP
jgi:hypothetical protein